MNQYVWTAEVYVSAKSEDEAEEIMMNDLQIQVVDYEGNVRKDAEVVVREDGQYVIAGTDED